MKTYTEETNAVDEVVDQTGTELLGKSNTDETNKAATVVTHMDEDKHHKLSLNYLLNNIRHDKAYRQKVLHTSIVWWSFVALGWNSGMTGPSFPDLRQIINEDIATASWIFTSGNFGYLIGSLICGFLYDKFNKILLLTLSTLLFGLSTIVTPFCAAFPWMIFIRFINQMFGSGLNVGGNADIIAVWGHHGKSYMQALHFGFSLGASISPLATEPFLAKKTKMCSFPRNITSELSFEESYTLPASASNMNIADFSVTNATVGTDKENVTCTESYEPTTVHFAFIVAGIITLTSTVGYAFLYIHSRQNKSETKHQSAANEKLEKEQPTEYHIPLFTKIVFLILLGVLFATYGTIENGFASYLMTFAIERLQWDKSKGSFITGLFWISFCIGRFLGIFIIECCHTAFLLTIYLSIIGCSYIGLLLSTLYEIYPLIWVFTVTLGFSLSIIFPAMFSWTENLIEVTGKISSYFLSVSSLSAMFYLFLIGNLMDSYDTMWFVYIMLIAMAICFMSFVALLITARNIRKHRKTDKDVNSVANGNRDKTVEMKLMK